MDNADDLGVYDWAVVSAVVAEPHLAGVNHPIGQAQKVTPRHCIIVVGRQDTDNAVRHRRERRRRV